MSISFFFSFSLCLSLDSQPRVALSNVLLLLYFAASVFAYGQTSSGKTYTMSGITEYTVADIYDYIERVTKP